MGTILHIDTTVQPDGSVHVPVPGLQPGQRVSVAITPANEETRNGPSVIDFITALPGHRLFHTAEEVDDYIREERDSWER
jgi:hypothetical protein